MAISRGLAQFSRRINAVARAVNDNSREAVRVGARAALSGAVRATPVDTAMAVSNWIVSLNETTRIVLPPHTFQNRSASSVRTIRDSIPTIASFSFRGTNITITNSVPYIIDLENGTSTQAPGGILPSAVLSFRRNLAAHRLLEGI